MEWISVKDRLPTKYGKYWVCRLKAKKQHPRIWNGSGWAYDAKEITHWAEYPEMPSDHNSDIPVISERYLLVEWIDGNPSIDGALFFNDKKSLMDYWESLPKIDLVKHTICTIRNAH